MIKNSIIFLLGLIGGLWIIWPGIITRKGFECSKDLILNSGNNITNSTSLLADINRQIRVSSSLSPKTLIRSDKLTLMDKLRIVGDSCLR